MVVELEVGLLCGTASPEVDVGLVPDLEVPLRDFIDAVTVDKMLREGGDKRVPLGVILRRRDDLLVPEGMVVEARGELLRHEADLDEGADSVGEQAVVDLIDVGEVVDGVALLVFVVDAEFVVKDGVEADVPEVGDLLHGLHVVAIALAHGEHSAAGAEHLLPEMRERRSGGVRVDGDGLSGLGRESRGKGKQRDEGRQSLTEHEGFSPANYECTWVGGGAGLVSPTSENPDVGHPASDSLELISRGGCALDRASHPEP